MVFKRITVLVFICVTATFAQKKEFEQHQQRLNNIRSEIKKYEQKLESESIKEANILDMLASLDQEVDLTHALLQELKTEEQLKSADIVKVAYSIKSKRQELERLQEIYKKRLVNFYKHGRRKDLELLLTSKSFNQVLLWIKYQKLVAANDRRNFRNILKKKNIIENKKDVLKEEILKSRKIIKEKNVEERKLKEKRNKREKLLVSVRQNKQLYLEKLKQYEISAKEIERLISQQEEKRINLGLEGILQKTDFPKLRGKMIWPTRGRIITGFGKYKHPQLKTITESLGIDIQADFGEEVRTVGNGVVTAITWQRGRGNIVIVNHYGGYYTVYTHLSNIFVQIDNVVRAGQVIGEVGDTGSLRGPMLHFEIWQNNKVLDPSKWLG